MIHLGMFLLVFIFVSFRFLMRYEHMRLIAYQNRMSVMSGYLLALGVMMFMTEVIYWAFYLIYHSLSN
jgi:hypothetical protein